VRQGPAGLVGASGLGFGDPWREPLVGVGSILGCGGVGVAGQDVDHDVRAQLTDRARVTGGTRSAGDVLQGAVDPGGVDHGQDRGQRGHALAQRARAAHTPPTTGVLVDQAPGRVDLVQHGVHSNTQRPRGQLARSWQDHSQDRLAHLGSLLGEAVGQDLAVPSRQPPRAQLGSDLGDDLGQGTALGHQPGC